MSDPDIKKIREEFPVLKREVNGRRLVYLDNTATSQTPRRVVEKITDLYYNHKANVHRGVHALSQEMTLIQEDTREKVRQWINAGDISEIVFTRGTTEAINLAANSFGNFFKEGDEIILTVMEHHANIVPWQMLRERKGVVLKVTGINDKGELDVDEFKSLFSPRTVMAAFCHVSNVLGSVNPVKEMTEFAHERNVNVLIDGAQASPHLKIDVRDLDCDFYVFSSHKMYGPTGVGVLYGKKEHLLKMPPWQGGGEMISTVSFDKTVYADIPFKFEAGTPDFVGIGAFSSALDFISETGLEIIERHEMDLCDYAISSLKKIEGVKIYGEAANRGPVLSFLLEGVHPYDVGMLLDKQGVAVRTGHHCAMPLMEYLGIPGTVRASFAVYNTFDEVDAFTEALKKAAVILR